MKDTELDLSHHITQLMAFSDFILWNKDDLKNTGKMVPTISNIAHPPHMHNNILHLRLFLEHNVT